MPLFCFTIAVSGRDLAVCAMRPRDRPIANYFLGGGVVNLHIPLTIKIRPDRRFLRLDRLFDEAVRSGDQSAIVEVLLLLQLSVDTARRTADKILAERRA